MSRTKVNYLQIATFSPNVKIGNPMENAKEILRLVDENISNASIFVFPELSITGATCGDLFLQTSLLDNVEDALFYLETRLKNQHTRDYIGKTIIVGAPLRKGYQLFDCAVVITDKGIKGVVPKTYISNNSIEKESRYFSSGFCVNGNASDNKIEIMDGTYPFEGNLLFEIKDDTKNILFGIEFGEEGYSPNAPNSNFALNGANLIINLSSDIMGVRKNKERKDMVISNSKKNICAYVYVSAGKTETTTNGVFSGHKIIACNGNLVEESNNDVLITTIDLNEISYLRLKNKHLFNKANNYNHNTIIVDCYDRSCYYSLPINVLDSIIESMKQKINPYPFLPNNGEEDEYYNEIIDIQTFALAQRLNKTHIDKMVIGVSGGLDSTLALLIAARVVDYCKNTNDNMSRNNIIGITMPGFGTTSLTKNNSLKLMKYLDTTMKTIPIVDACVQHFKDIGHDEKCYDITYENVQARERTQILMDTANKENALVIGTGDMSELALGWCTYNGDHMSMYGLNAGIPKTLIKALILHIAKEYKEKGETHIANVLYDICETPISPELLPTDKDGNMVQTTEKSIGKYDLHDFFMYYMLAKGYTPTHIYALAKVAFKDFKDINNKVILETMKTFYSRFFTQQFKRSCMPDGPSILDIGFSPRTSWFMPSDADRDAWLKEIEELSIG